MGWIINMSRDTIQKGAHLSPGTNSMLIQIGDPCGSFPLPKYPFAEIHQFEFLDTNDEDNEFAISDEQAYQLATLLLRAANKDMNVLVHCTAGICRSGAVTEVGVALGLTDTKCHRIPNVLVKIKLLRALGMYYN